MGLRFRKSVKLGGLRINFSKSGIGYSYGVKGLRYTKTAKGKERITASIPGTGISYVAESNGNRNTKSKTSPKTVGNASAAETKNVQYQMPLVLNLIIGIISIGGCIGYYLTHGHSIGLSILSGILVGGALYVVLYGIFGAVLMVLGIGKTTDSDVASEDLEREDAEPILLTQEKQEDFNLAGSYYCKTAISKVAIPNPDWRKTCKALVNAGKDSQKIYRFCRTTKAAELVEEPSNSHDPNAVMVTVEGEKVGYISADEALHVKEIMRQHCLKSVTAVITGGEYKTITPDAEMIKNQSGPFVTVKICYR